MIAYLLQNYLYQKQITVKALAKKLGFSERQVGNWLRGKYVPVRFSAECICHLLLQEINPIHHREYNALFWALWNTEDRWRVKRIQRLKSEALAEVDQ